MLLLTIFNNEIGPVEVMIESDRGSTKSAG